MRVSVLASGSNGNATCVRTTNESFLIDDGLSFKMLYARMEETTWIRKTLGEAEGIGATTGRRKEKRDRKTRGYFFLCYFISREIISFNKWLHFIW